MTLVSTTVLIKGPIIEEKLKKVKIEKRRLRETMTTEISTFLRWNYWHSQLWKKRLFCILLIKSSDAQ